MTSSGSDEDSEETSLFKRKKKRTKYRRSEDRAILRYLLDDDHCSNIGGNTVWKDMHMLEVTRHTWQSMKARFTKHILPNIEKYSLKIHEEAKLTGILKGKTQGKPTDNPTPPQASPVEVTAAQTPPLVLEFHAAHDAHGDMSTDDQLDDFDRLLFANAPDNPTAPERVTGSASPWKQDMDKGRNLPCVSAGVNGSGTQRINGASTRNTSAASKRTLNDDGETIEDHVPRMRRKRPLEFRALNKDDVYNENGASERNITSAPTDETTCYVDLTVPCAVVIGKCPPVDSRSRYRVKSPRKQHTRRLRSPDDELDIVEASTSSDTSPRKMTERRTAKTRCMIEAAEDDLPTIAATKTKRSKHSVQKDSDKVIAGTSTEVRRQTRSGSRAEQDSDEEGGGNDGEYLDPRSYLASRRAKRSRVAPSATDGLQSVISFVMSSSDESQEEEAASDDGVETHRGEQQERKIAQNKVQKQQAALNKDGMSSELKTFDAIVQWLAVSPKDFVDIVLRCDGSVDDAVIFILTGRKRSGGSTKRTAESRDVQRSTATANHQKQRKLRRCRNEMND